MSRDNESNGSIHAAEQQPERQTVHDSNRQWAERISKGWLWIKMQIKTAINDYLEWAKNIQN